MPLLKGSGQHIIGANVSELRRSGYPERQAVAIAYSEARKHRMGKKSRKKLDNSQGNGKQDQ